MSHQTLSDETKAWKNSKGLSQTWPQSFSHMWFLLVKQPCWTLHSTYKWVEGTIATPWDGHEPVATLFPRFSTARWRQLSLLRVTVIRRLLHVAYGPTLPNMKGHGLYFPYPPIKSNQYSGSQWDYLHKRIKTANAFGIASRSRRKSKMPELAHASTRAILNHSFHQFPPKDTPTWMDFGAAQKASGRSERDFAHCVQRVYAMKSDCNLWSLELCNLSLGLQVRYLFFLGRAVNPKLIKHRQLAGNCLRKQKNLLFDGFDLPRHKFWGE